MLQDLSPNELVEPESIPICRVCNSTEQKWTFQDKDCQIPVCTICGNEGEWVPDLAGGGMDL